MAARGLVAPRTIRVVAWTAVAIPALMLGVGAAMDALGANPVEAATHDAGIWALRCLVASLAITPLRRLGLKMLAPARRIFGVAAFAWASLHFSIYLVFDLGFDFGFLAEDIVERPYLTIGFTAFLLLLALGVTSTRGWQKRLGRKWVQLHRAAYPAAALSALHFYWLVKADVTEPAIYAGVITGLLGFRLADAWRARAMKRPTAGAAAPGEARAA